MLNIHPNRQEDTLKLKIFSVDNWRWWMYDTNSLNIKPFESQKKCKNVKEKEKC